MSYDSERIKDQEVLISEVRRRILRLLLEEKMKERGLYLLQIARALNTVPPNIVYHLRKLKNSGFVEEVDTGYRKYYLLTKRGVQALEEASSSDSKQITARTVDARVADVYGSGMVQVVLENEKVKVVIAPYAGGRIAQLRFEDDLEFLFRIYPRAKRFGQYVEYGGIEDTIGPWPGMSYSSKYAFELEKQARTAACLLRLDLHRPPIRIEKRISLEGGSSTVRVEYRLTNQTRKAMSVPWSTHPELAIGGSPSNNYSYVPTETGVEEIKYYPSYSKIFLRPKEGWCAATNTVRNVVFGQIFPQPLIDKIGLYPTKDHHTMELIAENLALSTGGKASFSVLYHVARGGYDTIREKQKELENG
jgi:DNA-binding transcriptional ArsR family regulator